MRLYPAFLSLLLTPLTTAGIIVWRAVAAFCVLRFKPIRKEISILNLHNRFYFISYNYKGAIWFKAQTPSHASKTVKKAVMFPIQELREKSIALTVYGLFGKLKEDIPVLQLEQFYKTHFQAKWKASKKPSALKLKNIKFKKTETIKKKIKVKVSTPSLVHANVVTIHTSFNQTNFI